MVAIGGAAEKTNLEIQHIAAALGPEKGRVPALNKDLADLTERMKKAGGKSVFEAEIADNPEDKFVNFDEMRRVLDDENKRVASEPDKHKKADMQKRYDRLTRRYNVYDKLLNNEGFGTMSAAEQKEMMSVMADLPGFCESIALATNNTLTIDQARQIMMGKGGVALSPDQRKVISEMILQFANDGKLHNRISKGLSTLAINKDDMAKAKEIDDLRIKTKGKAAKEAQRVPYQQTVYDIEGKYPSPEELADIEVLYEGVRTGIDSIHGTYKPANMTMTEVDAKHIKAQAEVTRLRGIPGIRKAVAAGAVDILEADREELRKCEGYERTLKDMKDILAGGGNETKLGDYKRYSEAKAKVASLDKELLVIYEDERQMVSKEGELNVSTDRYKRKMEVTLSEEMKRYWNEVKLSQAQNAAEGEAQKKAEEKQKAETEKAKRETLAKTMLDKYLYLSFIKYKGNKAVGMDDKALKNFVKKDMLSRSPAQLTKDFLNRIDSGRYGMPLEYANEIKKMYAEAGIGVGTPPLTLRKAIEEIGNDKWEAWAAEKVPDVLGYAYNRRYYFDRLKINPAQAEFLRRAYSPEFFTKALDAKKKHATEADEMLKSGLLTSGAVNEAKIKELLGGDWVNGSKRIMKTLAVAGAIGAGTFALTGGLGSGLALNILDPASVGAFLSEGAAISGGHITDAIAAGTASVRLASKASGAALGAVTGHLVPPSLDTAGKLISPAKSVGGIQEVAQNIYNTIDTLENPKP